MSVQPSVFTKILEGKFPAAFVYRDDVVAAFMSIGPLTPGHVLVVPTQQIDHWIDLPTELASKVFAVAQRVGQAIDAVYAPNRVGVMIAGDEVPHAHVHVLPINSAADLNFANAKPATLDELKVEAQKIAEALND
jgi:histidine triad (HIT) family protein